MNADGVLGANQDLLSYNLFAYCSNNPVNNSDSSGKGAEALQNLSQQLAQYGPAGMILSVGVLAIYGIMIIPWDSVADGISGVWNTVVAGAKELTLSFAKDYESIGAKSKTKAKEATKDATLPPKKTLPTYYHWTTSESAAKIWASQYMKPGEGGYVYAWKLRPDKKALAVCGGHGGVLISFQTIASFVPDETIKNAHAQKFGPVQTLIRNRGISVRNVQIVGYY